MNLFTGINSADINSSNNKKAKKRKQPNRNTRIVKLSAKVYVNILSLKNLQSKI
jgi:hypothetical protein